MNGSILRTQLPAKEVRRIWRSLRRHEKERSNAGKDARARRLRTDTGDFYACVDCDCERCGRAGRHHQWPTRKRRRDDLARESIRPRNSPVCALLPDARRHHAVSDVDGGSYQEQSGNPVHAAGLQGPGEPRGRLLADDLRGTERAVDWQPEESAAGRRRTKLEFFGQRRRIWLAVWQWAIAVAIGEQLVFREFVVREFLVWQLVVRKLVIRELVVWKFVVQQWQQFERGESAGAECGAGNAERAVFGYILGAAVDCQLRRHDGRDRRKYHRRGEQGQQGLHHLVRQSKELPPV